MSTKAAIAAKITGISDGGLNTAAEVRSLDTDILNEQFPTLINVLSSATTYATPTSNTNYPYDFLVSKNGGKVSINGIFRNTTGLDSAGLTIALITNTELLVSAAQVNGANVKYRGKAKNSVTGHIASITIQDISGTTVLKIEDGFIGSSNTPYEIIEPLIYNTKN